MFRLTTLLRSVLAGSLGNAGAVVNARSMIEREQREAWVVEGLVYRLEPGPAPAPAVEPALPARVA